MKYNLQWMANRLGEHSWFKATVPGNIQNDYGIYKGYGDIHYGKNVEIYEKLEDDTWLYQAFFSDIELKEGERVYFKSNGIDYECEISLNDEPLLYHEGMFEKIKIDITDHIKQQNLIEIKISPHPVGNEIRGTGRDEASRSAKPAVGYGWDWHPRLLASGMWQEAWLEIENDETIKSCYVTYTMNENRSRARVCFDIECNSNYEICLYSPKGELVHKGCEGVFEIDDVMLWWCNGQGNANRYRYTVKTKSDETEGYIGFKTVKLVMNDGSWDEPSEFPKSRSTPPVTICLNGRNIFAKGSNWVRPELFPGTCDINTYKPLVKAAKEANMNIFRCWGGSEIFKDSFYDLCDEMGIMVWQEFPLACNNYPDDEHYLEILGQEATAIIKNLRSHVCISLWCGGNELFNNWSGMTDQSLPLRLLGKLCYEYDRNTPFIMASPLMGMAHGGYTFKDYDTGEDVFYKFSHSKNTAYTEFGVPSTADEGYLKTFIPQDELFPVKRGNTWEKHHAFNAWTDDTWLCTEVLEEYFGKIKSLEDICKNSQWLQCEGYKAIFEEARRQWPKCSMAINWCFNEPWKIASGNSLISYPDVLKPAYFAVQNSLRPYIPSARIEKFDWSEGEFFSAQLWMLNDSPQEKVGSITASLVMDGNKLKLLEWENIKCPANTNVAGHTINYVLPKLKNNYFVLRLETDKGVVSEYKLLYKAKDEPKETKKLLNI